MSDQEQNERERSREQERRKGGCPATPAAGEHRANPRHRRQDSGHEQQQTYGEDRKHPETQEDAGRGSEQHPSAREIRGGCAGPGGGRSPAIMTATSRTGLTSFSSSDMIRMT